MVLALASSSQDSSLILWDIATGDKLKTMETGATDVWTLDFSPDGKHVISGSNAGKILIFSVENGKQEQTLDTRGKFTLSVAYVSRKLISKGRFIEIELHFTLLVFKF